MLHHIVEHTIRLCESKHVTAFDVTDALQEIGLSNYAQFFADSPKWKFKNSPVGLVHQLSKYWQIERNYQGWNPSDDVLDDVHSCFLLTAGLRRVYPIACLVTLKCLELFIVDISVKAHFWAVEDCRSNLTSLDFQEVFARNVEYGFLLLGRDFN